MNEHSEKLVRCHALLGVEQRNSLIAHEWAGVLLMVGMAQSEPMHALFRTADEVYLFHTSINWGHKNEDNGVLEASKKDRPRVVHIVH